MRGFASTFPLRAVFVSTLALDAALVSSFPLAGAFAATLPFGLAATFATAAFGAGFDGAFAGGADFLDEAAVLEASALPLEEPERAMERAGDAAMWSGPRSTEPVSASIDAVAWRLTH